MKRIITTALALSTLVVAAACGSQPAKPTPAPPIPNTPSAGRAAQATATAGGGLNGALGALAGIPTALPTVQAASGVGGRLVFTPADNNVYVMPAGGGPAKQVTQLPNGGYAFDSAWLPNGKQIIYAYAPPLPKDAKSGAQGADLYLINDDGSDAHPAVKRDIETASLLSPHVLADGKTVIFSYQATLFKSGKYAGQVAEVAQATIGDDAPRKTIAKDASDQGVSRDGKKLAYVRTDPQSYMQSLIVSNLDGSEPKDVISSQRFAAIQAPVFFPDGNQLLFAGSGVPMGLRSHRDLASQQSPLLNLASLLFGTAESASAHGLPWDLYAINLDGSGMKRLTNIQEDQPWASFSPDGKRIVFLAALGIYQMDANGQNLIRLNEMGGQGRVDWSP